MKPTFYQVDRHLKEKEIMGICVPDIAEVAPNYGRKVAHYVVAILYEMGG